MLLFFLPSLFASMMTGFMSTRLAMEVATVNPIETMFFPRHHIIVQVHSSVCEAAVKVAMGRRFTERILKV